jgi:hypothetical protein
MMILMKIGWYKITEKEKFEKWFDEQTKKGLIGFNVSLNPDIKNNYQTIEEAQEAIYKELNSINKSIESGNVTEFSDF